jgi:NAD(P)-dependent dehydrogenase (short-subunit alcohol dehydrogenase family)
MNKPEGKSVLITGANTGLGKDVARQLAGLDEFGTIYLACRNESKAQTAKADLRQATGKTVFEIVLMDTAELTSGR